jgi:lysophospholipase L1-like esterase
VACWGDSLTIGATTNYGNGYPEKLTGINPLYQTVTKGYSGENSSDIRSRMIATSNTTYRGWVTIVWVGHNDTAWNYDPYPVPNVQNTLVSNIQSMVSVLTNTNQYLVIGILNDQNFSNSTLAWSNMIACNARLAGTFPGHYLDSIATLQAAANTLGEQAATNIGLWPSRLCTDNFVHLADEGYALIAHAVNIKLLQLLSSHSVPATPSFSGNSFVLSFNTTNQQSYLVERKTDLNSNNWIYQTNLIGTGLPTQTVSQASGALRSFFRVRQP